MWTQSILVALVLVGLSLYLNKYSYGFHLETNNINSTMKWLIVVLGFVYLLAAYISQPMFYSPANNGHLGDNYIHMRLALENPAYLKPHHILYPLVPGQLVAFATKLGFLNQEDPQFYEKAYTLGSLPVRLGVSSAVFLFGWYVFRLTRNFVVAAMAFLFVATSYGFWVWGIQNSGIGLAMAVALTGFVVGALWFETNRRILLFCFGLLAALAVFMHISQIYFAIGCFLFAVFASIKKSENRLGPAIRKLLPFLIGSVPMAILFYALEAQLWDEVNPFKIFKKVSEVEYLGGFGFEQRTFLQALDINLRQFLYQIANRNIDSYYQFWHPEPISASRGKWEFPTYVLHLGSLIAIAVFGMVRFRSKIKENFKGLFYLSVFTSVLFFLGFTLRPASSYSAAALPAYLLLLISVNYGKASTESKAWPIFLIGVFVVSGFFYNVFSVSAGVYRGQEANEHPYYAHSQYIQEALAASENAIFYHDLDLGYYPTETVVDYYAPKFSKIKWRRFTDYNAGELKEQIRADLGEVNSRVLIHSDFLDKLDATLTDLEPVDIGGDIVELKVNSAQSN